MAITNIKIEGVETSMKLEIKDLFWDEASHLVDLIQNKQISMEGRDGFIKLALQELSWKEVKDAIDSLEKFKEANPQHNDTFDANKYTKVKEILSYAFGGQKLNAVKMIKDQTGLGLKESKDMIDRLGEKWGKAPYAGSFENSWPDVKKFLLENLQTFDHQTREWVYPIFTSRELHSVRGIKMADELGLN